MFKLKSKSKAKAKVSPVALEGLTPPVNLIKPVMYVI